MDRSDRIRLDSEEGSAGSGLVERLDMVGGSIDWEGNSFTFLRCFHPDFCSSYKSIYSQ